MKTYSKPLDPELMAFWKEHETDENTAKIKTAVATILNSVRGLSDDSLQELAENWASQADTSATTAAYLKGIADSRRTDDVETAKEWDAGALRCLVSYWMYVSAVKQLEVRKEAAVEPPKKMIGESAESYKARLMEYVDSIM